MILSHKPTILKELKGDSLRKESAELNTTNQLYTKKNSYECNSLRAVNNLNERQKNTLVVTVLITENSRKAYLCFPTIATCKLLTIFTCILNYKRKKADILTTAGGNKMSRQLLSKMPIISVNLSNIIHTQSNSRVMTKVSTAHYQ